ncbi:MAG TPA: SRPBCC family protein [Streptosporangiaceae bacterium]
MAQNTHENGSDAGPLDRLKSEATGLLDALGDKAVTTLKDTVESATDRLTDYTNGGGLKAAAAGAKKLAEGKSPMSSLLSAGTAAVKEKLGGKGKSGGGGKGKKVTNIIESIDVGVPVKLAYDQWTRFTDFPKFMKKVEGVDQQEDEKLTWKAQVLWSHRTWESTILEQIPDDKIVWRSKGAKGYVDGAVTFHELAPNLTRILVVLEYHPQGLFEHTGNLWRAQGRRVRLELKLFRRHVMTEALLHADEIEGWRGVISDGQVQDKDGSNGKKNQEAKQGRGAHSGGNGSTGRGGSRRQESASGGGRSQGSKTQSGNSREGTSRQGTASRRPARAGSTGRGGSRGSAPSQAASRGRRAS